VQYAPVVNDADDEMGLVEQGVHVAEVIEPTSKAKTPW
jgi:hypothetical protein